MDAKWTVNVRGEVASTVTQLWTARELYRPLGFGEIEGEFAGSKHDDVRLNILQLRARF